MSGKSSDTGFIVWGEDKMPHGPLDVRELVALVKTGHVVAGTWVYVNRSATWERAADLVELQLFFQTRLKQLAKQATHPRTVRGIDLRLLRRVPLLAKLSDDQLARFTEYVTIEEVPQGVVVVKQGDRGNAMFIVLEGHLSVHLKIDRVEKELAMLKIGDCFGDFCLFDHGPRSADVIANMSCTLLRLSVKDFDRLSEEATDVATPILRALGKTLTARIRASNKHHAEVVRMAHVFG